MSRNPLGAVVGVFLVMGFVVEGERTARAQGAGAPAYPASPDAGIVAPAVPPPAPPGDSAGNTPPEGLGPPMAPPGAVIVVPEAAPAPQKAGKGKKRKNDSGDVVPSEHVASPWGAFDVKGRLFARADLSQRSVSAFEAGMLVPSTASALDISVPSARVSLRYRAPVEWLTAEIELDAAGKPDLKDGYINARGKNLSARFGQFKLPSAALEMESPWVLPLVRRGFISDLIVDRLDVAGRRPGLMFGWRAKGLLKPRLSVGAFQGTVITQQDVPGERETDLIENATLESQSVAARGQVELGPVQLGAYYQHRLGSPAPYRTAHYWTAGGDVTVDWVFGHGGLRVWLDGMAGASWYEKRDKAPDGQDATFLSGRVLVAYRVGGTVDDAPYFEVYGLGAALDPDADLVSDLAWETVLGFTVGLWNRTRLSLQGEMQEAMRNFPESYFLGLNPNRKGILMQGGITF